MWWLVTIILIIISLLSSITLFYALRRINQYENIIIQFQQIVEFASQKMKQVDSSGHYESDDETGFFFDELKKLQKLLNSLFEDNKQGEN